MEFCKGLLLHL